MGRHRCEYLSYEQAKALNVRHLKDYYSSGDITLVFASGRSWRMPDMARLYVELGWVPRLPFILDVMGGTLTGGGRNQSDGIPTAPVAIGYLNPRDNPLPLRISDQLPMGFLARLEMLMESAQRPQPRRPAGLSGKSLEPK